MFLIPGLTIFKNKLSLVTTSPDGVMEALCPVLLSESLLKSCFNQTRTPCCILMACLGLFLVAESIASLHLPNMSALFTGCVWGIL